MQAPSPSFPNYLFHTRRNQRILVFALLCTIVQFILFKLFYPFPDFFSDSYSYIYAASANLNVSIWPIGYSKFLALFHLLTHSDLALIAFQYFFLESSALYFFFTVLYFYSPARLYRNILFILLFINPLFLYIANYVNSDPLFAALSILWFVEMIWIINRPRIQHIFTQAILLFLCFTVRNNAYYYPLIAVFAYILSQQKVWLKFIGCLLGPALIIPFIFFTRDAAEKLTGKVQYSLFTGWQLANNALYFYDKIHVDVAQLPTTECRKLDRLSREFFATIPSSINYREYLQHYVGNYFIRQPEGPLKRYFNANFPTDSDSSIVVAWGKSSIVFNDYGTYLIRSHPIEFLKYFVILNAGNYFLPPLEKLQIYNLGLDDVPTEVQDWFDYKTPQVWSISNKAQVFLLFLFPSFFLLSNLLFICCIAWFAIRRKSLSLSRSQVSVYWLIAAFVLINFGFSALATINVLRYQFFPLIMLQVFALLSIEWLIKTELSTQYASVKHNKPVLNL